MDKQPTEIDYSNETPEEFCNRITEIIRIYSPYLRTEASSNFQAINISYLHENEYQVICTAVYAHDKGISQQKLIDQMAQGLGSFLLIDRKMKNLSNTI